MAHIYPKNFSPPNSIRFFRSPKYFFATFLDTLKMLKLIYRSINLSFRVFWVKRTDIVMRLDRKEKKDNFIKINTRRVYNERWKLDGIRKLL